MASQSLRGRVAGFVESRWFQNTVIAVIVLNGITLGLETYEGRFSFLHERFLLIESLFVGFFAMELALKMFARGWSFFRDGWNWFDLFVVGVALIPLTGSFSVLRLMRVLRLLRLISVIPNMREIVNALFRSVPGLGTVIGLLFVVMYTAAVMGEKLFGRISPDYFGNLGTTLYTLFMLLTTENWPDISDSVIEDAPYAWIFFVVFIVISAFIVLNLIIGVIVTSMEEEVNAERWEEDQEVELEQHQAVMLRLEQLSSQVAALSEQVGVLGGSPGEKTRDAAGPDTKKPSARKERRAEKRNRRR
ncbi:ion transporter [Actinorugispora endophytica]|uniref:Voltage-gated sodium channel n=1 Tax=Actinorugispora endophytica TaxID=1605990 RepID=A0A4R6UHU5_9ACTN|nr:ion transporter [Actinorugispora endophytica]TDQ45606.1 voltage-gated sodium channel [Actinorugispora endophytica]